jgi:uncharacterized membrane protein YeaQ/YmgE (transglycosylase-associated protein family)
MHLLWWIVVGLIAGWATGKIMRGSGYGAFMDIVIGIVGAIVGGWIMRALGFSGQRRASQSGLTALLPPLEFVSPLSVLAGEPRSVERGSRLSIGNNPLSQLAIPPQFSPIALG